MTRRFASQTPVSWVMCFLLWQTWFGACVPVRAADWPCWGGPAGNDTTTETSGWDGNAWPLTGPTWTASVGAGAATPLVVAGRVYVMGWRQGHDTVACLDAATGERVWQRRYPCPSHGRYHSGDEGSYSGPSATPAYDPVTGLLYTLSIDGDFNCWNTREGGRRVWGMNLYDTYKVPQRPDVGGGVRDYGYSTAPLIYGDWVIVEVGAHEGALMAFDKASGRRVWVSQCHDPAGQCGGLVLMTVQSVPCVAVLTIRELVIVRLDPGHEGQTATTWPWQTDYANSIPTPAVAGDLVILTSDYNLSRTVALRVTLAGVKQLWQQRYYSQVCSPVIHDGYLYLAWGFLRCADLATGKQLWTGGRFGNDGSILLTADNRLIVCGNGRLALVEAEPQAGGKYVELASRKLKGRAPWWPHVVLAGGRIYAKSAHGELLCFTLKQ